MSGPSNRDERTDLAIAIVGLAGRFPGAPSIEAFWRNLRDGVESVRDLSEEELRASGVDAATLSDPRFVRRAADLTGVELFDAGLFGFTPREAELMDPQFRVFLEDAWTALEDAGYLTERHDLRIGVFAGSSANTYLLNNLYTNPRAAESVGAFQTSIGNERDYLAAHVSYRLDLRGPSVVVQTACSTSLVAIHMACQSLLDHECDVALAGGVSISVPQTSGYLYEEGGIASPDGRCRAFDAAANGCVKGNGSAAVVLRRLDDALRDGDSIRSIIRGSAVNNDGSAKIGFTAPAEEGQTAVIAEALSVAGVEPGTIGYVEAHGTATALGDPVEIAALARAFASPRGTGTGRAARTGEDPSVPGSPAGPPGANRAGTSGGCALGSVKTNIGHLDAAAGVAGLVKTVLALGHGEIPPSLHFRTRNPKIDLAGAGFQINTRLRPWARGETPRRAGVSSFGIGGTNAHIVLEESPEPRPAGNARRVQLLVLSAATESALAAASGALAARLESDEAPGLADAAYTLQVGRKRLPWRRAIAAETAAGAIAALRVGARGETARRDERRRAQVAFLFPGQGVQRAGMAAGLHRDEAVFRDGFDLCADLLRPLVGHDLGALLFAEDPGVAEERLRGTALAQPALFAVEYALARLWMSWGIRPAAMLGHSIGEYVAAALAGVMSLEDAARLVAERGRMIGALPRGAMLAVALPEPQLTARLARHRDLSVAAVNGPASCVASGPESAIAEFEAELGEAGIAARRLHTSHAFHSAMMDPVLGAFEARVRRVRLAAPSIPFVSNVTGTWIAPGQATDPAYWASHLRRTVRFGDGIATLLSDPDRVLLEVGPGGTLASLARLQAGPGTTVTSTLPREAEPDGDEREALTALGRLWGSGVEIDWESFHRGFGPRRVALPTYPFERQRYWVEPGAGAKGREASAASAKNRTLSEWFYVPGWKRTLLPAREERGPASAGAPGEKPFWILFDDGSSLGHALADLAKARGAHVARVRPGSRYARGDSDRFEIDPRRREHFDEMLREMRGTGFHPRCIVHLWCADGARLERASAQDLGLFALMNLVQAIGHAGGAAELRLAAVVRGLFDVVGETVIGPERATLVGLCRVAPQEYAGLNCRLVDIPEEEAAAAAGRIADELASNDREPVVAWRGGHRWIPSYTHLALEPAEDRPGIVRQGGVYVLTGGTGPLELAVAGRLAAAGAGTIVFLECGPGAESAVAPLAGGGVGLLCEAARVTDPAALAETFARLRGRSGRVDAVFCTSGTIGGGMIQLKDRTGADRVLAPRLLGAPALAGLLGEGEHLVLFSSAISATGVFGQVDFCAASAFLDAFAHASRRAPGPRVLALDWGTAYWDRWEGAAGAGSEALLEQLREIQSAVGITIEEGVDALWRALGRDDPQILVSTQDIDELVAQSNSSSVAEFLEGVGTARGWTADRERREIVPPVSGTERKVAALWSGLLGIEPIGRTDSFFDLGGNSLLAIQLASQLRKAFDIDLTIASLFESADLASLAAAVDAALEERRQAEEVSRLLEEIEGLTEEEIRSELARSAGAEGTESAA